MRSRTQARVVTVGTSADADIRAVDVRLDALGRAAFTVEAATGSGGGPASGSPARTRSATPSRSSPRRSSAAWTSTPSRAHCPTARSASRWRMEVHERPDGVTVVNDAYNANPDSMHAALEALRAIGHGPGAPRRTWAVLGEMLELGDLSRTEHERVGGWAAESGTDRLVVVGPGAAAHRRRRRGGAGAGTEVRRVDERRRRIRRSCSRSWSPGDVVLLKSSRDAGLRWLGDRLVGIEVPA